MVGLSGLAVKRQFPTLEVVRLLSCSFQRLTTLSRSGGGCLLTAATIA